MSALKPGPDIDALMAEKVMKWEVVRYGDGRENQNVSFPCVVYKMEWGGLEKYDSAGQYVRRWSPSIDIVAAWKVHEKMLELDRDFEQYDTYTEALKDKDAFFHLARNTAHIICLAALKAVGA